ncbi:UDP-2,3-diacylglucosamine diphosphatase [Paracrocinitomix mangrovi]|uniref:UDP-2,3-diacylglucosamine diphosphatase n=1 Tax=Paracrocinitomix mangrovi TaxID=2862509 RepID=UPI001C8E20BA|nr:UDP-2,3-diacylglucosamine diphosphatase [Paracrocinitomix mangrovi]UKN02140.1 UDP-2,3-diacylglucosamine diphosphatase [Paracrocinitomix mangrovi]
MSTKKIFFASDFHLGAPDKESSLVREKKIVKWLDTIAPEASEIFLLGDVFDFWFEYKRSIPKGFVRLQGKIAELTDAGIKIHWFIGNHDMWIFDYIPEELGVTMHRKEYQTTFGDKKFFIGHGDGLGPGDRGYKFIKKVFRNKFCQWCFARLHPNFGIGLANFSSRKSRAATGQKDDKFYGDKEMLTQFSKSVLENEHFDYFVFGHRHYPMEIDLNEKSKYINLGDWINHFTYAIFDGEKLSLEKFDS